MYIEQKYLLLVSPQLSLFKKKSDYLYNFRCPYCGDSQKSQHKEQTDKMTKLEIELQGRVGVLEKWRWIIIGGSIVAGFIIQKMLVL